MSENQRLLHSTSLNVSEVAFTVGFESHSAFALLFRQGDLARERDWALSIMPTAQHHSRFTRA